MVSVFNDVYMHDRPDIDGRSHKTVCQGEGGDRNSIVCNIRFNIKQPTTDEFTSLQTHASNNPSMCTDAAQHDSFFEIEEFRKSSNQYLLH